MTTRRTFLQSATLAAVATQLPPRAMSALARRRGMSVTVHRDPDDAEVKVLAARALDAAVGAGAQYADVRITAERKRYVDDDYTINETCRVYIGVRALAGGGWGFAATAQCDPDAVARLGREAAAQARATVWDTHGAVTLDDAPPTESGEWSTPVQRDPFTVSSDEMCDLLHEIVQTPERLHLSNVRVSTDMTFRRQAKLFAATTGAIQRQTRHTVGPSDLKVIWHVKDDQEIEIVAPFVPLQSGGYERIENAWSDERVAEWAAEARTQLALGVVTIGRYPMVFDAATTASLVQSTLGYATELDRVRGDEVNAIGGSYLTPASLGMTIASPLINIQGTHSLPAGPSTVRWDDDGVAVAPFELITQGRLVNFATSRALVREPVTARTGGTTAELFGHVTRSTGCSAAASAADLPLVRPPDLVVQPAAAQASFTDLVATIPRGVAVMRGHIETDERMATGQGTGELYEIRNGRIGAYLGKRALFSFKTLELWKNAVALGGPGSGELFSFTSAKGEPKQSASHGVVSVPMVVKDVALRTTDRG